MTGWGFGWLDGRATEERPSWGFSKLLAHRLAVVESALDIDTGGGEVINEAPMLPAHMVVTESWPPNAQRAREILGPRGVHVVETLPDEALPFPDATFDLVSARHPVRQNWREVYRVLRPGGHYFAQHVGPASAFELIEYFRGPLPEARAGRDPRGEAGEARAAGLTVDTLATARCRMEFFDIGAVVWNSAEVRLVGARLCGRALRRPAATPGRRHAGGATLRGALHTPPHRRPTRGMTSRLTQ